MSKRLLIGVPHITMARDMLLSGFLDQNPKNTEIHIAVGALNSSSGFHKECKDRGIQIHDYAQKKHSSADNYWLSLAKWQGRKQLARISSSETVRIELSNDVGSLKQTFWGLLKLMVYEFAWLIFFQWNWGFGWLKKKRNEIMFSTSAKKMLEEIKPDEALFFDVFSSYLDTLMTTCIQQNQIKTIGSIRSWDNLTCKGYLFDEYDRYVVWNQFMEDELIQYYNIPKNQITQAGFLLYDSYQGVEIKQRANEKKVVKLAFMMAYPDLVPNYRENIETITSAMNEVDVDCHLTIRIQPGPRSEGVLEELERINQGRFEIDKNEEYLFAKSVNIASREYKRFLSFMDLHDIIINYPSTTTIDAALLNIPSITIGFDNIKEYSKSIRRYLNRTHYSWLTPLKGNVICSDEEALKKAIIEYAKNPNLHEEGRELVSLKMNPPGVGNAKKIYLKLVKG